jgi:hypothetical protein
MSYLNPSHQNYNFPPPQYGNYSAPRQSNLLGGLMALGTLAGLFASAMAMNKTSAPQASAAPQAPQPSAPRIHLEINGQRYDITDKKGKEVVINGNTYVVSADGKSVTKKPQTAAADNSADTAALLEEQQRQREQQERLEMNSIKEILSNQFPSVEVPENVTLADARRILQKERDIANYVQSNVTGKTLEQLPTDQQIEALPNFDSVAKTRLKMTVAERRVQLVETLPNDSKQGVPQFSGTAVDTLTNSAMAAYISRAQSLMGDQAEITIEDAKQIFDNKNIAYNEDILQQLASDDGKINAKELAAILNLMDGRVDEEGLSVNFDGNIEDKTQEGGDLADTLQFRGNDTLIENTINKFRAAQISEVIEPKERETQLTEPPERLTAAQTALKNDISTRTGSRSITTDQLNEILSEIGMADLPEDVKAELREAVTAKLEDLSASQQQSQRVQQTGDTPEITELVQQKDELSVKIGRDTEVAMSLQSLELALETMTPAQLRQAVDEHNEKYRDRLDCQLQFIEQGAGRTIQGPDGTSISNFRETFNEVRDADRARSLELQDAIDTKRYDIVLARMPEIERDVAAALKRGDIDAARSAISTLKPADSLALIQQIFTVAQSEGDYYAVRSLSSQSEEGLNASAWLEQKWCDMQPAAPARPTYAPNVYSPNIQVGNTRTVGSLRAGENASNDRIYVSSTGRGRNQVNTEFRTIYGTDINTSASEAYYYINGQSVTRSEFQRQLGATNLGRTHL